MAIQRTFIVSAVLVSVVPILTLASRPAHAAGPPTSTVSAESNDDSEAIQQTVKVIHTLNVGNPPVEALPDPDHQPLVHTQTQVMIQTGNPTLSGGQNAMQAIPPELQSQLDRVQALLNNPALQKYLRLFSDPDVQRDAQALINSPQRVSFFFWEAGFIVFMLAFKTWLTLKSRKSLVAVIFVQIWTLAVFLAGVLYVLPRCVFGPDYARFVESFWSAITR